MLIATVVLVASPIYLPALTLGPIVEQFTMPPGHVSFVPSFTCFLHRRLHSYRAVYSDSSTLHAVLIRYWRTQEWTSFTSSA